MKPIYGIEYGQINTQGIAVWESMEPIYFQGRIEGQQFLEDKQYKQDINSGCFSQESEYNTFVARIVPLVPFEATIPNYEKALVTAKTLGFDVIENSPTPGIYLQQEDGKKTELNSSNHCGLSFLFEMQEEIKEEQTIGIQVNDIIIERSTNRKLRVKSLMGNSSNVIDFLATYVTTTTQDVDGYPVYMDRGFKFQDEGTVWSKASRQVKKMEPKEENATFFTHFTLGTMTKKQVEDSLSLLADMVANLDGLETWEEDHAFGTNVDWEEEIILRYQDLLKMKATYEPKLPPTLK